MLVQCNYIQDKSDSEIGFPCVFAVVVCRNHIQFPREIRSFIICNRHGQDVLKFWEFYDQSWTIDKSPPCAKVEKIDS